MSSTPTGADYVVSNAGTAAYNGGYNNTGTTCDGVPKYKHISQDLWMYRGLWDLVIVWAIAPYSDCSGIAEGPEYYSIANSGATPPLGVEFFVGPNVSAPGAIVSAG